MPPGFEIPTQLSLVHILVPITTAVSTPSALSQYDASAATKALLTSQLGVDMFKSTLDRVANPTNLTVSIRAFLVNDTQSGSCAGWSSALSAERSIVESMGSHLLGVTGIWTSDQLGCITEWAGNSTTIIAAASTSTSFSSAVAYPYMVRTVPADNRQAESMLRVMQHWQWIRFAAIYFDDNYSLSLFGALQSAFAGAPQQLAAAVPLLANMTASNIVTSLQRSVTPDVRVILVIAPTALLCRVFDAALSAGLLGNGALWIGTDTWNGLVCVRACVCARAR